MTERHYPWDVLKIDETNDKKLIKKAYAVLIKQYKPDEYLEEFKEIQEAYKYALNILKWNNYDKHVVEADSLIENNAKDGETQSILNVQSSTKEIEVVKILLEKAKLLLLSELIERENKYNWKFLDKANQIFDIQIREQFSQQLFALLAEHNLKFHKKNKRTIITTRIMQYINSYVNWDVKWQDYSCLFDNGSMQVMYMNLESNDEIDSIEQIDLTYRFRVLFSDLIMSYAIAGITTFFTGSVFEETLRLTFYIFVIQRFILEIIFNKSMGKFSKHVYITDTYGNKCSIFKTLTRHLIINVTLLPIYIWVFQWNIYKNIWIAGFCAMFFLHLISVIKYEKLFHDIVSKTIVIKKTGGFEYG